MIENQRNVEFLTFSGGEEHVQIKQDNSVSATYDFNVELHSSENIMRFFMCLEALNEEFRLREVIGNVNVKMHYLPYARQDRHCAPGQAFSLKVFLHLLREMVFICENINFLFNVLDVHSNVAKELAEQLNLNINFISQLDYIRANYELNNYFKENVDLIVCPDKGAYKKSDEISSEYNISLLECFKTRDPKTGYISNIEFLCSKTDLANKIKGKRLVIPDDICDGGMTFILLAKELRKYEPKSIDLLVSHGIFSKGIEPLKEYIDDVYAINCMNEDLRTTHYYRVES